MRKLRMHLMKGVAFATYQDVLKVQTAVRGPSYCCNGVMCATRNMVSLG